MPRITPSQYLIDKGWRKIGQRGNIKYWDHPLHQPLRHGAFITTRALRHQKAYDKTHVCDCIKPEEGR